jgi:hypothetical protein
MAELPHENSNFSLPKPRESRYIIKPDARPSDIEYALMSQHVYQGQDLKPNDTLTGYKAWKIELVHSGSLGYLGILYVNTETRQMVIAHRGTVNFGSVIEDYSSIILNEKGAHSEEAFILTQRALDFSKNGRYANYHLSFTGHSLGGFLAGLCVFYCHQYFHIDDVNAVTFECPGLKEKLESLQHNYEEINIRDLDIINYVTYPNAVNTFGVHAGSLYSLKINLGKWGELPIGHTIQSHSIKNILRFMEANKGRFKRDYQKNWPIGFTFLHIIFSLHQIQNIR